MSKPAVVRTELPDIPDFFGVAGRVQTVSDLIESAQAQAATFASMRTVNGHKLDDAIPADGDIKVTYGERLSSLREGIAALTAENEDIHDELVAEALKRRRKRERDAAED